MDLLAAAQEVRVLHRCLCGIASLTASVVDRAGDNAADEILRQQLLAVLSDETVRLLKRLRREMLRLGLKAKDVWSGTPISTFPQISSEFAEGQMEPETKCMLGLEQDDKGRLQTLSAKLCERLTLQFITKFIVGTYSIFRRNGCVLIFPKAYRWWVRDRANKWQERFTRKPCKAKKAEPLGSGDSQKPDDGDESNESSDITEDEEYDTRSPQPDPSEAFGTVSYHSFVLNLKQHVRDTRSWNFLLAIRDDIQAYLEFAKPSQALRILASAEGAGIAGSEVEEIAQEQKAKEHYLEIVSTLKERGVFCGICSIEVETPEELQQHLQGRRHKAVQAAILEEAEQRVQQNASGGSSISEAEVAQRLSTAYEQSQLYTSDHYHLYREKCRVTDLLGLLDEEVAHAQRLAGIQSEALADEPLYTSPPPQPTRRQPLHFSKRALLVAAETLLVTLSPAPLEGGPSRIYDLIFSVLQQASLENESGLQHAWESLCTYLQRAEGNPAKITEDLTVLTQKKKYIDPNTGQEVPSWFFETHQLQKEFPCEVCGKIYYGPITFERHFKLPRHQLGLGLLGVSGSLSAYDGLGRVSDVQTLSHIISDRESLANESTPGGESPLRPEVA